MSKNFDMMQQAEISITGQVALPSRTVRTAAKTESFIHAAHVTEESLRDEALKLVQRLFLAPEEEAPKAVTFTGIEAACNSGRMSMAAAQVLAESVSGTVCLVQGNYLNSTSNAEPNHPYVSDHNGLADSLRRADPVREFAKQIGPANLWLLPFGEVESDPLSFVSGDPLKKRVAELRSAFDYLLIDAPPLSAYAGAVAFGRLTDGVVIVVQANETRREAALKVLENLRTTGIPVLGAVLNNRTFPIPNMLYKRL